MNTARRVLMLYRPRLPGQRAQAIQVVHCAQAMAEDGAEVTILADRGTAPASAAHALSVLGLAPTPGLSVELAPLRHSGVAGIWFRRRLAHWWSGPPGLVLARDKRRLARALHTQGRAGHRIVLETHERDGATDPDAAALERALIPQLDALIANCEGTLDAWEAAWSLGDLPRRAAHNGCAPGRSLGAVAGEVVDQIVVMGSRAPRKGLALVGEVAHALPLPVHVHGPADGPAIAGLHHYPPLPYTAVPAVLARARVLLLTLGDGVFGEQLTSPLKLWDYLATARPLVAPDLPSVRRALAAAPVAAGPTSGIFLHRPHDAADLLRALTLASAAPPRAPVLRTWHQRLNELRDLLGWST